MFSFAKLPVRAFAMTVALSFGLVAAAPARADGDDALRLLGGAIALGLIANALNDNERRVSRHHYVHRYPRHRIHRGYGHRPHKHVKRYKPRARHFHRHHRRSWHH
ncbi:hypothetical protein [Thalassococcus sp. S3]|uniref:hypothetical protein n=1 Tax=Thalassococcus sp. S3 TaxID=2017482 RepID=UPI00102B1369|nr:hypothetical protein [Thalassococcus sp. S3]